MSKRHQVLYSPRFTEDLEAIRQSCPEIVSAVARGPALMLAQPGRPEMYFSPPGFPDCRCVPVQPRDDRAFIVIYRVDEAGTIICERLVEVPPSPGPGND